MRGMAAKAYRAGFNVIRMNQRTCGGTDHLTPTLYNSGLSSDYRAILRELSRSDGLSRIWLVGYSMGAISCSRQRGNWDVRSQRWRESWP